MKRKHREVVVARRPGCEGEPGGAERDPRVGDEAERRADIGRRVAFVQHGQQLVVDGLERRGDEADAEIGQRGQQLAVIEQVLDLDRYVKRQLSVASARCFEQFQPVCGRVEEIRIAEGDVASPHRRLLVDVAEHRFRAVEPQPAGVDGRERAVGAAMGAAARGLGVAGQLELAFAAVVTRVGVKRGKPGAIGHGARVAVERNPHGSVAARQRQQLAVCVAGQGASGDAHRAEAVEHDLVAEAPLLELPRKGQPESSGSVHRGRDGDQVGPLVAGFVGRFDGQVEGSHIMPVGAE